MNRVRVLQGLIEDLLDGGREDGSVSGATEGVRPEDSGRDSWPVSALSCLGFSGWWGK